MSRELTARMWLACYGYMPLELPPGLYGTDGWRLWRISDGEEAEGADAEEKTEAAPSADDHLRGGGEEAGDLPVHGGGDDRSVQRQRERGDGVRELRGSASGWRAGRDDVGTRCSVSELWRIQR